MNTGDKVTIAIGVKQYDATVICLEPLTVILNNGEHVVSPQLVTTTQPTQE